MLFNKISFLYFSFFFLYFFFNYSFAEIFDEDLIIISCFLLIFFSLKTILTNLFVSEIDNRILEIRDQIVNVLLLKKEFLTKNLINYNNNLNLNSFFNNTYLLSFIVIDILNIILINKLNEIGFSWIFYFEYSIENNYNLEYFFLKNNKIKILTNVNVNDVESLVI